jgi:hypothetical protein
MNIILFRLAIIICVLWCFYLSFPGLVLTILVIGVRASVVRAALTYLMRAVLSTVIRQRVPAVLSTLLASIVAPWVFSAMVLLVDLVVYIGNASFYATCLCSILTLLALTMISSSFVLVATSDAVVMPVIYFFRVLTFFCQFHWIPAYILYVFFVLLTPRAEVFSVYEYSKPLVFWQKIFCSFDINILRLVNRSDLHVEPFALRARLSRVFRVKAKLPDKHLSEDFLSHTRSVFNHWSLIMAPKDGNPHTVDAAIRRNGNDLINACMSISGRKAWDRIDIQTNHSSGNQVGTSLVYDPVDVLNHTTASPSFASDVRSVLTMVDVDFHTDMAYWMSLMRPMLLYTMLPTSASAVDNGSSHHYFHGDVMHFESHGGFVATHKLWDYGADYCEVVYRPRGSWHDITYVYRVLRYALPASRGVVALVPQYSISAPPIILSAAHRHSLRRHVVNHPGRDFSWTAFNFWCRDGLYVTVAAAGPHSRAVTVPWLAFSEVLDTLRVLGGEKVPEHTTMKIAGEHAYLLCRYARDYLDKHHQLDTVHLGRDTVTHSETPVAGDKCACTVCTPAISRSPSDEVHAKYGAHESVAMPRTVITGVPSVMVDKPGAGAIAIAPIRDHGAAESAVEGRVTVPQQKAKKTQDPRIIRPLITPFVTSLLSRLPKNDPLSEEQVLERVKPSARLATAEGFRQRPSAAHLRTKAFIKGETLPDTKPPRIITPLDPAIQAPLYKYAYALQDALHNQNWFAFGRPLPSIAKHIAKLSRSAKFIIETDYSKFDGTVSAVAREVELAVYKAYFPTHVAEIEKLHRLTLNLKISLKGKTYHSGTSRSSGAPDTCLMNSILNLFAMYATFGEDAFENCLVGGDDGLAFIMSDKAISVKDNRCPKLDKMSAALGFDLKCAIHPINEPFTFLSRIFYPGDPNSIACPVRLLSKLHIINVPELPKDLIPSRLAMKFDSLLLSDANTPVIGDVLRRERAAITEVKEVPAQYLRENQWWDKILEGGPWPNEPRPWMDGVVAKYVLPNGALVEVPPPD